MTDALIRYRDDIEWPLNEDGREKLLAEEVMHSPTIYSPEDHVVDPSTLTPFGGDVAEQFSQTLGVMRRRWSVRTEQQVMGIPSFTQGNIYRSFGVETPGEGAESVRADDPAWHPTHCRQWLLNGGATIRPGIFTDRPKTDFSNAQPAIAACMDAMPFLVSPTAFAVKYFWGLARPEQIVTRVLGETVDCPDWMLDALAEFGLTKDSSNEEIKSWFQYDHPPHPDYVAMHAAVAAFGYAALIFFDLTAAEIDAVIDYMEQVAHNRDTGGVHTWDASRDGFELVGLPTMKVVLPKLVADFGGNGRYVEELLEGVAA